MAKGWMPTQTADSTPFSRVGYASDNAADAIIETALNAGTSRFAVIFGSNGNVSNKWLELFQAVPSNTSPFVMSEVGIIASLAVSAKTATTATFEVYINGISVDSIILTSSQTNSKSGLTHSLSPNDTVSVKITTGSANDALVSVNVKAT